MSQYFVFHLKPQSPWHIGEAGIELVEATERLHADTLYSALCHTWALLGRLPTDDEPAPATPLPFGVHEPKFAISSAFPFVQCLNERVYFWPRPLMDLESCFKQALAPEDTEVVVNKQGREIKPQEKLLKNCRYVSTALWQALSEGRPAVSPPFLEHRSGAKFWMTGDEAAIFDAALPKESLFFAGQQTLTPRAALDRISAASNL
jgi:hypothetical protein